MLKKCFTIPAKVSSTGEDRKVVLREATRRDQKNVLRMNRHVKAEDFASTVEFMENLLSMCIVSVDDKKWHSNEQTLDNNFNLGETTLLLSAFDSMSSVTPEEVEDFLQGAEVLSEDNEKETPKRKKTIRRTN